MAMYTKQVSIKAEAKTAVHTLVQKASAPHVSPRERHQPQRGGQHMALTTSVSRILLIGVLCSSIMIMVGLLLLAIQSGGVTLQYLQVFPHTPGQVWSGLLQRQPQALIASGLLILIATPVLRVIVSIFAFNREHDRRYAIIALILLAILLTSFMLGKGGA